MRKIEKDDLLRDLKLNNRIMRCLEAADMCKIFDLLKYSEAELTKFRNLGKSSIAEIKRILNINGFKLKE